MGCTFLLSSSVSPTQCRAEGTIKFTEKLKKGWRGSSQTLTLTAETNMLPCFGDFGALATFNSSAGYRLIQLNPRREGDLVVNKRYCLFGGLGELEGFMYFFIEKCKAERLTHLLYIGLPEKR